MEKENNKIIMKKIFENLIILVAITLYFVIISFSHLRLTEVTFFKEIKIASMIVLGLCILIFEIAYHKDSGKIAIYGIEILSLSIYTLTIWTLINKLNITLHKYIIYSVFTYVIYYFLKSIIIYTSEKRKYLSSLSDIHEIVSNEPIKKEAKKRKKQES